MQEKEKIKLACFLNGWSSSQTLQDKKMKNKNSTEQEEAITGNDGKMSLWQLPKKAIGENNSQFRGDFCP